MGGCVGGWRGRKEGRQGFEERTPHRERALRRVLQGSDHVSGGPLIRRCKRRRQVEQQVSSCMHSLPHCRTQLAAITEGACSVDELLATLQVRGGSSPWLQELHWSRGLGGSREQGTCERDTPAPTPTRQHYFKPLNTRTRTSLSTGHACAQSGLDNSGHLLWRERAAQEERVRCSGPLVDPDSARPHVWLGCRSKKWGCMPQLAARHSCRPRLTVDERGASLAHLLASRHPPRTSSTPHLPTQEVNRRLREQQDAELQQSLAEDRWVGGWVWWRGEGG